MNDKESQTDAPGMIEPAIIVEGVAKTYGKARVALAGVDLTIAPGEWVALLGHNGSGKSTLLRSISTLDHPDRGSIRVAGQDASRASDLRAIRASLGVVFQSPSLDPLLTIRENLRVQSALFGMSSGERDASIDRLAHAFEIDDRLDDRVKALSGGLARRADLARALIHGPRILLLDEATGGLDHQARFAFLDLLDARRRERSDIDQPLTIVSATHLMDEAERADRVVMMYEGKIVRDGSPLELRQMAGERMIRVDRTPQAERTLAESGIEFTETSDRELRVALPPGADAVEILRGLIAADARLTVGPATLADAYITCTGAELEAGVSP